MRTSEFIAALAADPVPEPIRLGRRIVAALAIGFLGSLAIYGLLMGPRPDIAAACMTMRFWLKFVDSFAFALPSLLLTLRLARPDAKPRALALADRALHFARRWRGHGIVGRPARRMAHPAHRPQLDVLHADDSAAGRSHSHSADRCPSRRRPASPRSYRSARRRGLSGDRGPPLLLALPR